jgi:hypothetical protein
MDLTRIGNPRERTGVEMMFSLRQITSDDTRTPEERLSRVNFITCGGRLDGYPLLCGARGSRWPFTLKSSGA